MKDQTEGLSHDRSDADSHGEPSASPHPGDAASNPSSRSKPCEPTSPPVPSMRYEHFEILRREDGCEWHLGWARRIRRWTRDFAPWWHSRPSGRSCWAATPLPGGVFCVRRAPPPVFSFPTSPVFPSGRIARRPVLLRHGIHRGRAAVRARAPGRGQPGRRGGTSSRCKASWPTPSRRPRRRTTKMSKCTAWSWRSVRTTCPLWRTS